MKTVERSGCPPIASTRMLLAGERARVPPGGRDRWCNGGAEELHVIMEVEISPPAAA